jgi:hypothetical protein
MAYPKINLDKGLLLREIHLSIFLPELAHLKLEAS